MLRLYTLRAPLLILSFPLASALLAQQTSSAGAASVSGRGIVGATLKKVSPIYPPAARAAHVQGSVVLHAIIAKDGTVKSLTVVRGPTLLQASAMEAVKQWVYKPYLLNGVATEVDTTITVNFNLNAFPAAPRQLLAVQSPNPADIEKDADALYQAGNYPEAFAKYLQAANLGSETSQNTVATMYFQGVGTTQDYGQAVSWYYKAAQRGSSLAESQLGMMCAEGLGIPRDDDQAFFWLNKASLKGEPKAQSALGTFYLEGRGVQKNIEKAVFWYRSAASQGEQTALNQLANLEAWPPEPQVTAADSMVIAKREPPQPLSESQLTRMDNAALRQQADSGNPYAEYLLAHAYLTGNRPGLLHDAVQANKWFYNAADQLRALARKGDATAESHLGFMYSHGHGVAQDIPIGTAFYRKAAAQGDAFAASQLKEYSATTKPSGH